MAKGFQFHHHKPRAITVISWYEYASHIHPIGLVLPPIFWLFKPSSAFQLFWFHAWWLAHGFQTAHRWAHFESDTLSWPARVLQGSGLLISHEYHMQHHQSLMHKFSILSGAADNVLDFASRHWLSPFCYQGWLCAAVALFLLPLFVDGLLQNRWGGRLLGGLRLILSRGEGKKVAPFGTSVLVV